MEKTLLTDLKRKIFIRSALIAVDSLNEILSINNSLSCDQILLEIIKNALREFERTNPLILEMKISRDQMSTCYGMEGYYEIKSNFTLWLDCLISEDQIILVPNCIPKWRSMGSYPMAGSYSYFTDYRRPYLFMGDLPLNDRFYIKAICSRPIIPDFLPDKTFNEDSNKAAIYWMNVEDGGPKGDYFLDLCLCHLLDYIRQLKASVQLPGMSIDILGNVDAAYQELRSRCDQFALQSGWSGELVE